MARDEALVSAWINRPTREWHLEALIPSVGDTVVAACGISWLTSALDPHARIEDIGEIPERSRCPACEAIDRFRRGA